MTKLRDRSAVDIVVIIMTMMVASVLIIIVAGAVLLRVIHPEADLGKAGQVVASLLNTIGGALVGFVGGRAVGKSEANGITPTGGS